MRTRRRNRIATILVFTIIFALVAAIIIGLLSKGPKEPEPEPDPHAGQVYLYDGFDWVWMTPLEGVPVNELTEEKFTTVGTRIDFIGEGYEVQRGIDVSEHQKEIDWNRVAQSDIDYAYVRIGRRGYTEGGIYEDTHYEKNLKGAYNAGLELGVYFFSQAITVQEAIEEANFVLQRIGKYDISLPIIFDWEKVEDANARTADLTMTSRTDCAVAFCETIKNAGYVPGVYFNRNIGYYGFDLTRLTDYVFWFSLPEQGFPNFYYACDMWQYSFTESVPGISVPTDMNLRFIPLPEPEEAEPELVEEKPRKGLKLFRK